MGANKRAAEVDKFINNQQVNLLGLTHAVAIRYISCHNIALKSTELKPLKRSSTPKSERRGASQMMRNGH